MTDSRTTGSGTLTIHPLPGIPEVTAGMPLGPLLLTAVQRANLRLTEGDVLAVSSKVISKARGLRAPAEHRADLVLQQSHRVVAERRAASGSITRVVEALAGPVLAGAGIDASNTGADDQVLLLPQDPDQAARELLSELQQSYGHELPGIGLVVTDTAGRPWRAGQTDFALGACGVAVLDDLRGSTDTDGRPLAVTSRAVADEIAAAADLVKGKTAQVPAALLRGLPAGTVIPAGATGARDLVRTGPEDWFGLGATEAVRTALGVHPGTVTAERVGVATVGAGEEKSVRVQRAIRLATEGEPPARVSASPHGLMVHATDPFEAGRLCARLDVALASEGCSDLTVNWQPPSPA